MSNTTIFREMELLRAISELAENEEKQLFMNSVHYSFTDPSVKEKLIKCYEE